MLPRRSGGYRRLLATAVYLLTSICLAIAFPSIKFPFSGEVALYVYVYFELGVMIRRKEWDKKLLRDVSHRRVFSALICVAAFMLMIILSCENGFSQPRTLDWGNNGLLCIINSFLGIIGTVGVSMILNSVNLLCYLGRKTLPILVMHKFPILLFQSIIPFTKRMLADGNDLSGILWAGVVTLISIGGCLIAEKCIIAICPFVLGYEIKNKNKANI